MTDDAVTIQALHDAISKIARNAALWERTPGHRQSWGSDPGYVSPGVFRGMYALARDLGYQVRYGELNEGSSPGEMLMGMTDGPIGFAGPAMTITLQAGMSPASTARVLAHELSHVILGHPGRTTMGAWIAGVQNARGIGTDAREAAVELAAGAICGLAGIGTGQFSLSKVNSHLDGYSKETHHAALLAARTIWAAIEPALSERVAA